ncbi:MAG: GIY-YIG nuclease family protein [Candidatus Hodarchaeales archaeon]|jgi:excinuclease UvrABC nuclease subunit
MFNRIKTPLKDFACIPTSPGIYRFIDEHQEILYIGASKNLQNRVSQYFRRSKLKEKKISQIQALTRYIEYQEFENQESAFEAERLQIWTNRPRLNIRSNGIHSFSYLILRKEPHYHLLCGSNEALTRIKEHDRIFRFNLHSKKLEELIGQIRKHLRLCTSSKEQSCWEHQLNLCYQNCNEITKSVVNKGTNNLLLLINTLTSTDFTLKNEWNEQFIIHIDKMQFEEAQKLNTSLQALKVLQRRFAGIGHPCDLNFFNFEVPNNTQNQVNTTVHAYRNGILVSQIHQNLLKDENLSLEVFILYFLQDYFQTHTIVPKKVSINYHLDKNTQHKFKTWMRRYFHQPILLEICEN